MNVEDLELLIQDRVTAVDPEIDVSAGSQVDIELIQPLLRILGLSLTPDEAYQYVMDRMAQFNRNDPIDEADALTDLAVKPLGFLLEPIAHELSRLRLQTLRFPELLTREAAANIGANFFVEMGDGEYTLGLARLLFVSPVTLSVNATHILSTVNGERFIPSFQQSISQQDMFSNRYAGRYYFDVFCRSVDPLAIEVGPGDMQRIEGIETVLKVTNLQPFAKGVNRESVREFIERAKEVLTERSLVTSRGASARIRELFDAVLNLEIVGYNSPEMNRDTIEYSSSGDRARITADNILTFPLTLSGPANISIETDDGPLVKQGPFTLSVIGTYANIAELAFTMNQQWIAAGGKGCIFASQDNFQLMVQSATSEVYQDSYLKLITPPIGSAWTALGFSSSQVDAAILGTSGIVISSMANGLLRPNLVDGRLDPGARKYHMGGCTDIYVQPASEEVAEMVHSAVEDTFFAWHGVRMDTNPTVGNSDRIRIQAPGIRPGAPDFSLPLAPVAADLQGDFLSGITVEPGDVLVVRDDTDLGGPYKIAAGPLEDPALSSTRSDLRLDHLLPFTKSQLSYHIEAAVRVHLMEPRKRMKISSKHGTRLYMYGGSDTAVWGPAIVSGIDSNVFSDYGVQPGDAMKVYEQTDGRPAGNKDEYVVLAITGNQLKLNKAVVYTEVVTFSVYERGGSSVQTPCSRIKQVDLSTSSGVSARVPRALPALIQSKGMGGAAVKMEGYDGLIFLATPDELHIPSPPSTQAFFKFTDSSFRLAVGDVVRIDNEEWPRPAYRKVIAIADYIITLDVDVPAFVADTTDLHFKIGTSAKGEVRFLFMDPVSFEIEHDRLFTGSVEWGVGQTLELSAKDAEDRLSLYFQPSVIGVQDSMLVFPSLQSDDIPISATLNTDFSLSAFIVVGAEGTMTCREHLLRPKVGNLRRDVVLIYPERFLGQPGAVTAPASDLDRNIDALLRMAWRYGARIPASTRRIQYEDDFFVWLSRGLDHGTNTATVADTYGNLTRDYAVIHPQPDGGSAPNQGNYEITGVPITKERNTALEIQDSIQLTPTDDLTDGCGRSSSDQLRMILDIGGTGAFVTGETVSFNTTPAITARVHHWDAATRTLWVWDVSEQGLLPSLAATGVTTVVGQGSGAAWVFNSWYGLLTALGQDGTKTLKFGIPGIIVDEPAPGFIASVTDGPWAVGRYMGLYGATVNALSSWSATAEVQHAVDNAGVWKITGISADGKTLTMENVTDPARTFVNANPIPIAGQSWVLSVGDHPLEPVTVYDRRPTSYPIETITYELFGTIYDSRLTLEELTIGSLKDYTSGRAASGLDIAFQIRRAGRTRVSSTEMDGNRVDNMYYLDTTVHSLGPETDQNLPEGTQLYINSDPDDKRGAFRGKNYEYVGEGYVLEVEDSLMTFSPFERTTMAIHPCILPVGKEDLEPNKLIVSGKNLNVQYAWSSIVQAVDDLITSDSERVAVASMMARTFAPALVRLNMVYGGTAVSDDLLESLIEFIDAQTGGERMEVSDLEAILHRNGGVDFIDQTFQLVVLFIDSTRTIWGERSRNFVGGESLSASLRLSTDRMSHFLSDVVTLNRN